MPIAAAGELYIYIYIYRERERERAKDKEQGCRHRLDHVLKKALNRMGVWL